MALSRKFTTSEIAKAFFTFNPSSLRGYGFTPVTLARSGAHSFADGDVIRGKIQYRVMLRFTPQEHEASAYEESGNVLSDNNLPTQAMRHWNIAFNHNHRPYEMTQRFGHYSLVNGDLPKAQEVFEHQVAAAPADSVAHNELGVVHLMHATRQNKLSEFQHHQFKALTLFGTAHKLNPADSVSKVNAKVAKAVNVDAVYHAPERYLDPKLRQPTPTIEAVIKDVDRCKLETKTDSAVGLAFGRDEKGNSSPYPTVTSYSYQVPRYANMFLLDKLRKIQTTVALKAMKAGAAAESALEPVRMKR